MDNLDKYLPLLIVVVSFVVSIVSSRKKKQKGKEQARPIPPVRRNPTFIPKNENRRTISFPKEEEEEEWDFPVETADAVVPAKPSRPTLSSFSTFSQDAPVEDELTSEVDVDLHTLEEVRKAILYSEILTKRYE